MNKQAKDRSISIRLSQKMLEALDEYALVENKDRTQVIRDAIASFLGLPIDPTEDRFNSIEDRLETIEERFEDLVNQVSRCVEFLEDRIKS